MKNIRFFVALWTIPNSPAAWFNEIWTNLCTETETSSGWLPWLSLGTLKLASNIFSDDQGSHPDDLSVSVYNSQNFFLFFFPEISTTWASWHLKLPALPTVFFQQLVRANNKENKAHYYWTFVRGIHQYLVDSPHKGPVMWIALPHNDTVMNCLLRGFHPHWV